MEINAGDTAWVLMASALVLFMTPGLALFYGGLVRRKNIAISRGMWYLCKKRPKFARRLIRFLNKRQLPKGYPIDVHFNPPYDPWDQRLCAVPDGDLFKAIGSGKASVVIACALRRACRS